MKVNLRIRLLVALTIAALLYSPILVTAQTTKPRLRRSTVRKRTTKPAVTPLVPIGTDLKGRINETLSSKNARVGDRFTATVINPSRFDEAKLECHIRSIQKAGKIKVRPSMNRGSS